MVTVVCGCGNPRRHRTSFSDPFFEDLTFYILFVVHHLALVHWLIQLAHCRVNTQLAEHAFHTKGARFVWHYWHDATTKIFILDRKSTRLNSSHVSISYAVFCLI